MAKIVNLDESTKNSSASSMKIFENQEFGKVRTIIIDGNPWFVGKDIALALGYSNTNGAIMQHICKDDKKMIKLSEIYKELDVDLPDHMKCSKIIVINRHGLSNLISKSEKIPIRKKESIMEKLGINICMNGRKETEFMNDLRLFFSPIGVEVLSQYYIGLYRVDFYIPSMNLVIEYDEKDHKGYDSKIEHLRERFILDKLNCSILRVSDKNENSYNLGLIANFIFNKKKQGVFRLYQ